MRMRGEAEDEVNACDDDIALTAGGANVIGLA